MDCWTSCSLPAKGKLANLSHFSRRFPFFTALSWFPSTKRSCVSPHLWQIFTPVSLVFIATCFWRCNLTVLLCPRPPQWARDGQRRGGKRHLSTFQTSGVREFLLERLKGKANPNPLISNPSYLSGLMFGKYAHRCCLQRFCFVQATLQNSETFNF